MKIEASACAFFATVFSVWLLANPAGATSPSLSPAPGRAVLTESSPSDKSASMSAPTATIACYGEDAPPPQYVSSNETIHYGYKAICSTAYHLAINVVLYAVEGTGDNQHNVRQAAVSNSAIAFDLAATDVEFCDGTTSTRWITAGYASGNGVRFSPYPAWSGVYTLHCGPWQ